MFTIVCIPGLNCVLAVSYMPLSWCFDFPDNTPFLILQYLLFFPFPLQNACLDQEGDWDELQQLYSMVGFSAFYCVLTVKCGLVNRFANQLAPFSSLFNCPFPVPSLARHAGVSGESVFLNSDPI